MAKQRNNYWLILGLGCLSLLVLFLAAATTGWLPSADSNQPQSLKISKLTVGELQANCYLVGDPQSETALLIDPGAEPAKILARVQELGWPVKYIVVTHGHIDHLSALSVVKKVTGAPVLINGADSPMLLDAAQNLSQEFEQPQTFPPADHLLRDGDTIKLGSWQFQVLTTPGHTPGSISLLVDQYLFSGDTLFKAAIGRTDLPGGSSEQLNNSIKTQLLPLPDRTTVYAGHGPQTTIGAERGYFQ